MQKTCLWQGSLLSALTALLIVCALQSCDLLSVPGDKDTDIPSIDSLSTRGRLDLSFLDENLVVTKADKSLQLDTNDFLLSVTTGDGKTVFKGRWNEAPSTIFLDSGTYCVRAESESQPTPSFDSPVWGDEQCVKVDVGKSTSVSLLCRQLNSGFRLNVSDQLWVKYPSSSLLLKGQNGSIVYTIHEKRYAYFSPGQVSLVMSTGATDETLMSRSLAAGEMFALKLDVSTNSRSSKNMTIAVDTTRNYTNDTYVIGNGSSQKGSTPENAYTISQAKSNIGAKGVWVAGYIVGGDLSTKSMSTNPPFRSATNFAIGPKKNTTDKNACLSVNLNAGSSARTALNLVDNPSMLGHYVHLKCDIIEAYYGIPGLKNISDYTVK